MPVSRRSAREVVLRALYEMDIGGHEPSEALDRLIVEHRLPAEMGQFAHRLLDGVIEKRREIDLAIERVALERPVQELSAIDRNILRIAVREFMVDNLTPVGAAINEAVELAKRYGSESSAKFINGVLGALSTPNQAAIQEGK